MEDPGNTAASVQKRRGEVVGERKQGNPMGEVKVKNERLTQDKSPEG